MARPIPGSGDKQRLTKTNDISVLRSTKLPNSVIQKARQGAVGKDHLQEGLSQLRLNCKWEEPKASLRPERARSREKAAVATGSENEGGVVQNELKTWKAVDMRPDLCFILNHWTLSCLHALKNFYETSMCKPLYCVLQGKQRWLFKILSLELLVRASYIAQWWNSCWT